MASLNPLTRELVLKLVFYGPGLGGKTTTLEYIHASTKAENRGQMISLATTTDRTLYFDFLPLRVPRVRGMNVRLQLFTVPGQVYYAATRRLVLSGADGIVFVADSQAGRMEANEESLEDLNANLVGHGKTLGRVAHTFHWNKRDLSDLVPMEELDRRLNVHLSPSLGTCATRGDGVFEGLERIARLAIANYEQELPKSGEQAPSLGAEGSPGSIADAIRAHAEAPLANKVTPFPGTAVVKGDRVSGPPPITRNSPNGATLMSASFPRSSERGSDRDPPAPPIAPAEERRASGDGWAVVASPGTTPVFSVAELWPKSEREEVRQAEALLATRDAPGAVLACELLFARVLASVPGLAGGADTQVDAGVASMLLGIDGRRYLAFRASVRAARQREPVSVREALECFAFVIEVRGARDAIGR